MYIYIYTHTHTPKFCLFITHSPMIGDSLSLVMPGEHSQKISLTRKPGFTYKLPYYRKVKTHFTNAYFKNSR